MVQMTRFGPVLMNFYQKWFSENNVLFVCSKLKKPVIFRFFQKKCHLQINNMAF